MDQSKSRHPNCIKFHSIPSIHAGGAQRGERCLRIQPSEKVTLITDEATREIAAAIARELEKHWLRLSTAWVLEELAQRPLKDMPRAMLDDMETQPGVDLCGAGADRTNCDRACR